MPRKKYDNEKVNYVGRFFQDITEAIFKCDRVPHDEGDFAIWDIGSGIEVKASDSNHEFRLPLHQLDTYRRMSLGFPYHNFFFFLYSYENPYIREAGRNRITSLSRYDEKIDVRSFLAENLSDFFIIDMSVLEFLFSVCRISDKSIPLHRGVKSLNVRPTYLKRLIDGGWQAINTSRKLQLRSLNCNLDFNPDLLESYKMEFKINILSTEKDIEKLTGVFHSGVTLS